MNTRITSLLCFFCGFALFAEESPVFTSGVKGHIFTDTHGALRLQLPEDFSEGTLQILDESGRRLKSPIIPGDAEEGFDFQLSGKGYYHLEAAIRLTDGSETTVSTTAAVVGPLLPDELRMQSRLGLWTVQGDPDLVLAAGARWNRRMISIHTLGQELLEPDPPPAERLLFQQTPFTQVGVMSFGLPLWLMEPTDKRKSFGNPLMKPTDWEKLYALVFAWARQQSENFPDYFEVYNEPEWQWSGSNEDLVRLLATVADGIKAAHPQTRVLGPGFSSIRIQDPARLDLVTANEYGLFDHLDGIVVHAYVDGSPPEDEFIERVMELQEFLRDIGRPDYPLHITEFGWTSGSGTWQRPVDELTQARYAVRSLVLLAALGVENATYFCLHYKAAPNEGERGFSLVRDDSTPKPVYAAFANVSRWLAGVQGLGTWLRLTPTTHLVLFEKSNNTSVAVVWDTEADRVIDLPFSGTRREDMTGRSLKEEGSLALSPSPVFLEFPQTRSPSLEMLPEIEVMRGGGDVPLPEGTVWMAPAPLQVSDHRLSVPATAANGEYLLLHIENDRWIGQPVRVIPPLEATAPVLDWPAESDCPLLVTRVSSHAAGVVNTRLAAVIEGSRDFFLNVPEISPGESRNLAVPLPDLELGRRYRGRLAVDSRHDGKRDQIFHPLDLTLLSAPSLKPGVKPDWDLIPAVDFSAWEPFGGELAPEDCSATFQAAHGNAGLYLRIVVRDDEHLQTRSGEQIWTQDSIQIGLDPDYQKSWEANDLFGLKGHRVFEYGVAWDGADTMTWRWISYLPDLPVGVPEPRINLEVTREGDLTTYEILFPWETLGLDRPMSGGEAVGISLAVTDADSGKSGRRGLRLFGGIVDGKDPEKFGPLWLR